ncbi:MAG: DEAD/DEAH box helicase family protein [Candidatus Colwellbacteria bacterium]|nr:DEAD/DEAH box helicase family protein [Candidatus Colwellbacteria bacterium]
MIILQKIIENKQENLDVPQEWIYRDLSKFGLDWELFPYQKKALENITAVLYLLYKDFKQNNDSALGRSKQEFLQLYRDFGLTQELNDQLDIKEENENFKFLSNYFPAGTRISFQSFINRAAFWMATGSGKTLVMVKLLAILSDLMNKNLIPHKDILILAPKDEILSQIKEHINKFNKGAEITINLRNLKEWEKIKNQQDIFNKSEINVFYYRADNIADKETIAKKLNGSRINYESIYNNGNWYLILDEAHKGEKETSKRQQYFMALTQNGFLFNFSATFTDDLDIATTVFDYKLDTFLKEGYGKKLYIADSDFRNFNEGMDDDFSTNEKKDIIAQTLIIFALAKEHFHKMQTIRKNLYHAPLLITLANSVNTEEADLKIFYKLLAEIARGKFNFEAAKNNLVAKLENNKGYLFGLGDIDQNLISEIRNLKKANFFKAVFNSGNQGNIEIVKFRDNSRELAFKLVGASKYFMLIVASDIIKWESNVLEGYEFGRVIGESFFDDINKRNDINILLGSRIFTEGWDTNRPNVINFINIGVSDDAKKFVLQSIGRGVRIEPTINQRKRFEYLDNLLFSNSEVEKIKKENNILESLFVFATNKEVVKNILEGLEKQANPDWIQIEGIKKNEGINEKELPIFVPFFEDGGVNNKPFWIGTNEYGELSQLVQKNGPKVLLLKQGVKLRTFNKISNKDNFKTGERRRKKSIESILFISDNYFNENVRKLSGVKILDGEILHYKEVKTNIDKTEVERLEKDILKIIKPRLTEKEIDKMFDEGKIDRNKYKELIKDVADSKNLDILRNYLDFEILEEHYYTPILFKQDTERFQHIIKKQSEIDFLHALKEYLTQDNNLLKNFDWWYFSKIDETIDRVGIPYFNSERSQYDNFYPDFIFWLKKGNKYYLKFIDPHGVEYTTNSADKIDGFIDFMDDLDKIGNKKLEKVDLYYFNEQQPSREIKEEYRRYWTNDFTKIFV